MKLRGGTSEELRWVLEGVSLYKCVKKRKKIMRQEGIFSLESFIANLSPFNTFSYILAEKIIELKLCHLFSHLSL